MEDFMLEIYFCLKFRWKEEYNNITINITG